jgi:hypothetical protein
VTGDPNLEMHAVRSSILYDSPWRQTLERRRFVIVVRLAATGRSRIVFDQFGGLPAR